MAARVVAEGDGGVGRSLFTDTLIAKHGTCVMPVTLQDTVRSQLTARPVNAPADAKCQLVARRDAISWECHDGQ